MRTFKYFVGLLVLSAHSVYGSPWELHPIRVTIPSYPAIAVALKETGMVSIRVEIDRSGNVASTEITAGPDWLSKSAEQVVWDWKFSTAEKQGRRCNSRHTVINFNYVLLPSDTRPSLQTLSFFEFPNTVEVRYGKPAITVNPTSDPHDERKN